MHFNSLCILFLSIFQAKIQTKPRLRVSSLNSLKLFAFSKSPYMFEFTEIESTKNLIYKTHWAQKCRNDKLQKTYKGISRMQVVFKNLKNLTHWCGFVWIFAWKIDNKRMHKELKYIEIRLDNVSKFQGLPLPFVLIPKGSSWLDYYNLFWWGGGGGGSRKSSLSFVPNKTSYVG